MESKANTGDDNTSFAFNLPDGYFVSQTPRIGLLGGAAMPKLPPPLSNQEAIGRGIMKEQIRQEILAREAERRILEEEVRRELEMERIMEMRRLHMERYSALAGSTDLLIHGDRPTQLFMPTWPQAKIGDSLGRKLVHDAAEFAFRERSLPHMVAAQSPFLHKPDKSSLTNEITESNSKLSGAKRKDHGELLPQVEKHWGCAICEVSSTSEKGLEAHLQGKKHKKMVLQSSKKTLLPISKKNLTASSSGPGNKQPPLMSACEPRYKNQPLKKQQKLICRLCKSKCNSQKMFEVHLNGKKHKMFMELKERKKVTSRDETVAMNEGPNEEPCGQNEEPCGPNEEPCVPNEEPCGPNEEPCGLN